MKLGALKLSCCSKVYSLNDPNTWFLLDLWTHKPTKVEVRVKELDRLKTIKVVFEYTLSLRCCVVCGSAKAAIFRFDKSRHLIREDKGGVYIRGKSLTDHLKQINKSKKLIKLSEPLQRIENVCGYIPFKYGKLIVERTIKGSVVSSIKPFYLFHDTKTNDPVIRSTVYVRHLIKYCHLCKLEYDYSYKLCPICGVELQDLDKGDSINDSSENNRGGAES